MARKPPQLGRPDVREAIDESRAAEPSGWHTDRLLFIKPATRGELTSAATADLARIAK